MHGTRPWYLTRADARADRADRPFFRICNAFDHGRNGTRQGGASRLARFWTASTARSGFPDVTCLSPEQFQCAQHFTAVLHAAHERPDRHRVQCTESGQRRSEAAQRWPVRDTADRDRCQESSAWLHTQMLVATCVRRRFKAGGTLVAPGVACARAPRVRRRLQDHERPCAPICASAQARAGGEGHRAVSSPR